MLVYSFLYLIILLLCIIKTKNKNRYISIILFLFIGLRYDVGWDFRGYYLMAENPHSYTYVYERLELFNKLIYKLTWYLGIVELPFLLYSFLLILFLYLSLKEKKNIKAAWIMFICFPLFMFNYFSLMRQGVAVMIVFYGFVKFMNKNKIYKFLLACLIATLFHGSAIFALIMIPIKKFEETINNKTIKLLLFGFSFFLGDFIVKILLKTSFPYLYYFRNKIGSGGSLIYYLIVLIVGYNILVSSKVNNKDCKYISINNIIFIGGIIFISIGKFGDAGQRMSQYFLIMILFVIDEYISVFKYKRYTYGLFYLLGLFLMIILLNVDKKNPIRSQYTPYKMIFFKGNNNFKKWK